MVLGRVKQTRRTSKSGPLSLCASRGRGVAAALIKATALRTRESSILPLAFVLTQIGHLVPPREGGGLGQ